MIHGWDIVLTVGGIGVVAGLLSGILGIGGGIIVTPLLLYLPQLAGAPAVSMRTIAGLTIVQGLLSSLAGAAVHRRFRFLSGRLAAYMGATIFVAAFAGGAASKLVSETVLLALFFLMAVAALVLILRPETRRGPHTDGAALEFEPWRAVSVAGGIGILGGMVGQGGSFILIPLMTSFVRVPTRIAIATNLAVVLFSSLAGFMGKALTGQIDWLLAVPLLVTVLPATVVGSHISRRLPVSVLRKTLAVVIGVAVVRIAITLVGGGAGS